MFPVKINPISTNKIPNNDAFQKQNSQFFSVAKLNTGKINQIASGDALNLSFTGSSHIGEFSNLLDKVVARQIDDGEASKLIQKLIPEVLSSCKDEMGRGFFSKVTRINEKYVLKQSKYGDDIEVNKVDILPDKIFDDLKTWFGAKIVGFNYGSSSVLKNANPNGEFRGKGCIVPEDASRNVYNQVIHNFSTLPLEAFDKVAKDFKNLNSKEIFLKYYNFQHSFDYVNPNNFMFSNNEMRLVDDIDLIHTKNLNSTSAMISTFIAKDGVNKDGVLKIAKFDRDLQPPRLEILKKSVLACEANEIPFTDSKNDYSLGDLSLKLCGVKKTAQKFKEDLDFIRDKHPDIKERIPQIENYLENIS